jgi:phage baseplate assembly protein W
MTPFGYPFHINTRGRVAAATDDEHIRQLIEQVLFTTPGERVNRPTFGSDLSQLVFAPNTYEQASAVQFLVQGALQQWLGDVIQVEALQVEAEETTLTVTVQYVVRRTQQRQVAQFQRGEVA